MKNILIIISCFLFVSCNYFDVKKTSSKEILNEELQSFNWKEIDEYPTFVLCDTASTKYGRKSCFENVLTNHILNKLSEKKMIVSQELNDTLIIEFKLSEKGEVSILNMKIKDETINIIPTIEEKIKLSINSLPEIYPAIKRGQQVSTQFKLPIIIVSD